MSGGLGVPMRLSANEVGDEGTYVAPSAPGSGGPPVPHKRTSSAQSRDSRYLSAEYPNYTGGSSKRFSQGSTNIGEGIPELEEKEYDDTDVNRGDSFGARSGLSGRSGGSGTSEREEGFGVVGSMEGPSRVGGMGGSGAGGAGGRESQIGGKDGASGGVGGGAGARASIAGARARASSGAGKTAEDLKRRGSVDERGLFPQGTGRLVIANPDIGSDSD